MNPNHFLPLGNSIPEVQAERHRAFAEAQTLPIPMRREIGGRAVVAANDIAPLGPGFLKSVIDKVQGEKSQEMSEDEQRYRELFAMPDPTTNNEYGQSRRARTEVTAESSQDAALAYRFTDADVQDVIRRYKTDELWREEDMPELVRTNDELRYALGMHFLDKMETLSDLPERVRENSDRNLKNPNHGGYDGKLSSRDYAALLALSMLDGTFNWSKMRTDRIEKDRLGFVKLGQHRYAAQRILGIENRQPDNR